MSKEPDTRALRGGAGMDSDRKTPALCSICGATVRPEDAEVHILAEDWVIEQIRSAHPQWVESDGACPKCLELYRNL